MHRQAGVPFIDRVNRWFGFISEGLNTLGTIWILALMLLINADAFGRSFLQRPITGVPEIVSLSIIGIVFLQLSSALRNGRLTRSDMLLNLLARHAPRLGYAVEALFNVAGAVTLWFLLQASWPRFLTSVQRQETVGVVGRFIFPTWPIKLILVVGAVALLVQFVLYAVTALLQAFTAPQPGAGIHLKEASPTTYMPEEDNV